MRRQRAVRLRGKVDDLDVAGIRHIDKNLGSSLVDLEALRMAFEADVSGLGPRCRIDNRKRALAVADEHAAALRIHPHIVGIIAELDTPDRSQIIAAQHVHRAVAGVCDIDAVGEADITHALGLVQTRDCPQHLAGRKINHAQAIVAELGDKQPLALQIDAEVIDTAAYLTKRDLRLEHERRARRLRQHAGGPHQARRQQDRSRQHASALGNIDLRKRGL